MLSNWMKFIAANIATTPESAGVYILGDGTDAVYFGVAQGGSDTIRSRLTDHFDGKDGPCTREAVNFMCEETRFPATRRAELLDDFIRLYGGKTPKCQPAANGNVT